MECCAELMSKRRAVTQLPHLLVGRITWPSWACRPLRRATPNETWPTRWAIMWHGYMNKLGPIASDRYVENLRLVVLSEYRNP